MHRASRTKAFVMWRRATVWACEELKVFAVMKRVELGVTHGPGSGGCCVTPRLFNGSVWLVMDLDDVTPELRHPSAAY